jgi:hypothetical protein
VEDGEVVRVERVREGRPPTWVEGVKSDAGDDEPDCITIKAGRRWECVPPAEVERVELVQAKEGNHLLAGAALGLLLDVCVFAALASTVDFGLSGTSLR